MTNKSTFNVHVALPFWCAKKLCRKICEETVTVTTHFLCCRIIIDKNKFKALGYKEIRKKIYSQIKIIEYLNHMYTIVIACLKFGIYKTRITCKGIG